MVAAEISEIVDNITNQMGKSANVSSNDSSLKNFNISNSDECSTFESTADSQLYNQSCEHNQVYLEQLMKDKNELRSFQSGSSLKHVNKLIDREISNVLTLMSSLNLLDSNSFTSQDDIQDEKVTLTETIKVPVEKYPRYNFVGRILGPRGMTAKQLEEETGCKIMVRGRGSSRVSSKREVNGEIAPLHVVIQCEDYKSRAQQKMRNAVEAISQLLHPPPEGKDELKRKQLIELSIINGTYRPTSATKIPLQSPRVFSQQVNSTDSTTESDPTRIISSLIESSTKNSRASSYLQKRTDPIPDPSSQHWSSMANILSMIPPVQQQPINPNLLSEYYKYLLSFPSPDPKNIPSFMPTQPMEAFNNPTSTLQPHSIIAQANLQQYLQAAAMLNSVPFIHDGSGDFQKSKRQ